MSDKIRNPAVAGQFYNANPNELKNDIIKYLSAATNQNIAPKAIIAPHAGYIYSGLTAGAAYVLLQNIKDKIKRVVLLGPSHRVYVRGFAFTDATHYNTPLGKVPLDTTAFAHASTLSHVQILNAAHAEEHSLEVHLPFLQLTLDAFNLIPIVVGEASAAEVASVLDLFWGGAETLIVISTDLSHFENYANAQTIDAQTCRHIENFNEQGLNDNSACGRIPVSGLLQLAHKNKMQIQTLDLKNSGDTAGTKDRVVGYGAWALF